MLIQTNRGNRVRIDRAARYPRHLRPIRVDRVLAVARGDTAACEVAGVGRIARHQQRLVVERAPPRGGT